MYEGIYISIKPTNDHEDKIEMFAVSPLVASSFCLGHHLLEIRAGAVWKLGNCEKVLLICRRRARIQRDDATQGRDWNHVHLPYATLECCSASTVVGLLDGWALLVAADILAMTSLGNFSRESWSYIC